MNPSVNPAENLQSSVNRVKRDLLEWVETLLEDFLRFVDVFGIFQTSVMTLKEEQFAAKVAIRKKDDAKIASYLKSRKRLAKEMLKLVSAIRCIGQYQVPPPMLASVVDSDLAGVVTDAVRVKFLHHHLILVRDQVAVFSFSTPKAEKKKKTLQPITGQLR